ncbi:MAG TPA: hypothetical protein V6C95_09875 [Coleofasciculaceae cyanobacterium]
MVKLVINDEADSKPQEPRAFANAIKRVTLPTTLYAFGKRQSPRPPRQNKDIAVENDSVKPTNPPTGASTFGDVQYAPLTGHYHKLNQGTELPEGLDVIADGRDVGGTHSPTHHTIYPSREMPFTEFVEKFLNSGWVYAGKKELR